MRIFVGEDHIDHTPKNEEIDLMLGRAFDVTARGKQVNYSSASPTTSMRTPTRSR